MVIDDVAFHTIVVLLMMMKEGAKYVGKERCNCLVLVRSKDHVFIMIGFKKSGSD